jgi:hypothetical protein
MSRENVEIVRRVFGAFRQSFGHAETSPHRDRRGDSSRPAAKPGRASKRCSPSPPPPQQLAHRIPSFRRFRYHRRRCSTVLQASSSRHSGVGPGCQSSSRTRSFGSRVGSKSRSSASWSTGPGLSPRTPRCRQKLEQNAWPRRRGRNSLPQCRHSAIPSLLQFQARAFSLREANRRSPRDRADSAISLPLPSAR